MRLVQMDIDQLLESTSEIAEEDLGYMIRQVEIDHLLERTQDW
ncbi:MULTISPECIES: hypothetical protein [Bacillales]|jgi:hypothetical protein|uniref:Uncharacterized protein n=1 Tax=Cytobacillus firmus TaxID=1399 RepID=A0AA46Q406_CYTFI|nr:MULTISPECIES: hypothetical protein [Bacillales]MCS0652846.1 hypothetical protein [Cytobacillus firmus]MCU1803955.1 hypothetical protein [Cytobacillus firmus]UYG95894.1 hypothetical protein OD459_02380 [Cytobacillus firmus]WHY36426.1 hypothetical protein QNH44_11905 [Cytobacillus firmus]WHY64081.1 hypothetical protein QNH42_12115 [Cytobacillus firmus]